MDEIPENAQQPSFRNLCGTDIVTKNKEILASVLSGQRDLFTLTKTEWNELLNPSPPNKLVYNYFRKLHNAFKTNAHTNRKYDSAFAEILRILKSMWEAKTSNERSEQNRK